MGCAADMVRQKHHFFSLQHWRMWKRGSFAGGIDILQVCCVCRSSKGWLLRAVRIAVRTRSSHRPFCEVTCSYMGLSCTRSHTASSRSLDSAAIVAAVCHGVEPPRLHSVPT